MITKDDLIAFEKEVAHRYEAGEIHAPIHLGSGNEDQLLEIFKSVSPDDWKLCTWRNHLHALLSGISPDELMRQILAGKSMSINSVEHRFYSSAIAGGILPVAVGLGMAIKRKDDRELTYHEWGKEQPPKDWSECLYIYREGKAMWQEKGNLRHIWCFIGDMTARMGVFHESVIYSRNFDLPVTFVIEDNGKSVLTDSKATWGETANNRPAIWAWGNVERYEYQLSWPHHGTGKEQKAF